MPAAESSKPLQSQEYMGSDQLEQKEILELFENNNLLMTRIKKLYNIIAVLYHAT